MKCSGKRLVQYLRILQRDSRSQVSLQRCFKEEHRVAVASGYVQKVVRRTDSNNDQIYKIRNRVWILTDDGSAFLRQLRGDFQPPHINVIETVDLFKSKILSSLKIPPDMLIQDADPSRGKLTKKILADAIQNIESSFLLGRVSSNEMLR